MMIVLLWFLFSVLVGVMSTNRGHSGVPAFFVSLILSPIVGLILVLATPDRRGVAHIDRTIVDAADTRPCPRCAETIKRAAVMCRFCQAEVEPLPPAPAQRASAPPQKPSQGSLLSFVFVTVLIVFAIIGGVSQLGTSANTTFNTISATMD